MFVSDFKKWDNMGSYRTPVRKHMKSKHIIIYIHRHNIYFSVVVAVLQFIPSCC